MKLALLSSFIRSRVVSAVLLMLATASVSHGMSSRHVRHQATRGRTQINFLYMVPQKEQANEWYQPPRSPGFNEDFSS